MKYSMKYADYKKLSFSQRRAYKKAGGEVEYPRYMEVFSNIISKLTVVVIVFLLIRCALAPTPERDSFPWDAAEVACLNAARTQTNSALNLSTFSNKDWGDDGYKITIRVEKKDALADLGVVCYVKRDGTIVKTEGILLKKKSIN